MKKAVEMGSVAMICITKFHSQTHRQHGDLISLLLIFFSK
jgi:hypothetical protein